jgi:hypothetical protein
MKRLIIKTVFLMSLLLSVVACQNKNKNDEIPTPGNNGTSVQTVKNLPANPTDGSGTGHYTFFSFKNNTIVPVADSATTQWDVAFYSTTILVNSGTSGPGEAGVQIFTGIFSDLTEAPADGYKQDSALENAIPTGSGNGWYNYNSTTHVISAIPGRVLVFKTAQGKYAKMEIISYYKDMPVNPTSADISRYYTFRYLYQDNGTKELK